MSKITRTEWSGRWEAMAQAPILTKLYWLLRIGVAIEYVGHGWAGLSRSRAWLPYYDLFGISADFALDHMYYITGTIDISVGLLVLFWSARILLLHATVWAVFTALLRPAAGEGWWEVLERGGNYGMPATMLILVGLGGWSVRGWLRRADAPTTVSDQRLLAAHWAARGGLALLLIGHGGFGAFEDKPYWYDFFDFFGIGRSTVESAHLMVAFGTFEIVLGVAVLLKPGRALLLFVLGWKLATELLRPLVGQEWFQFVERDGDYVLPIALILMAILHAEAVRRREATAPANPAPRSAPTN